MADRETERSTHDEAPSRRSLLKGAALTGIGAATAAAAMASSDAEAAESQEERVKARYRETEHVKRYYALNRL